MAEIIDMPGVATIPRRFIAASQALPMSSGEFRTIRERLGLSQAELASLFGVPTVVVETWEDPEFRPSGSAQVLMRLMGWEWEEQHG